MVTRHDHERQSASNRHIAIVGGGPRGLSALESLVAELCDRELFTSVRVTLFERSEYSGSGPNYAPDLFDGCWLNLPERLLEIAPRPDIQVADGCLPGFPDYRCWAASQGRRSIGRHAEVDTYPPRAVLGSYLRQRFLGLAETLQSWHWLALINHEVLEVRPSGKGSGFLIRHDGGEVDPVDEVLLTIGHQETETDPAIREWQAFADDQQGCLLVTTPYPPNAWLQNSRLNASSVVALRGMGLSMIDVVKAVTEGRGGRYVIEDDRTQRMRYESSGNEPGRIVPFSLDGLPLAAKPLNRQIDESFLPDPEVIENFRQACVSIAGAGTDRDAHGQLCLAVATVQSEVYPRFRAGSDKPDVRDEWQALAFRWLNDGTTSHELVVDKELPAVDFMQRFVDMACGIATPSFDYCLGQVWRHLQKVIFHTLSHSSISVESMTAILTLHERMKRYAYGPPVASLQCLLALHRADLLTFAVVDDPDIETSSRGWVFRQGGDEIAASVMIDTVLASPDLARVTSPLIRLLLNDGLLVPYHEGLGAVVEPGGVAIRRGEEQGHDGKLAMLGRLCKGRVMGLDSIIESFGEESNRWSRRLVDRTRRQVAGDVVDL